MSCENCKLVKHRNVFTEGATMTKGQRSYIHRVQRTPSADVASTKTISTRLELPLERDTTLLMVQHH